MQQYLKADRYLDFEHPAIQSYASAITAGLGNDSTTIATAIYLAVRDDIKYNAYTFNPAPAHFSASHCLTTKESYCIPKAVLLAALCRLNNIPARLGFANVKNHLASPQFLEYLQSDVFVMHGYTDIFLNDKWVKATPAFDKKLCTLMNVNPLEFDGASDSVFHEFDDKGARHMEYLKDHGVFDTVPRTLIIKEIAAAYPHLANTQIKETEKNAMYQEIKSSTEAND